jgi:hypothetical protein
MVGDWSVMEVGWDFPLRAKMAEGLALESLSEVSLIEVVGGTRRGVGRVFLPIDSISSRRNRAVK